jgi:hypothetical protein
MRLSSCVFATPPPINFGPVIRIYETESGGHAIEGSLDTITFNHVSSTIPKWRTFKLLRWVKKSYH